MGKQPTLPTMTLNGGQRFIDVAKIHKMRQAGGIFDRLTWKMLNRLTKVL